MLDLVRQVLYLFLALVIQTTWIHQIALFELFPDVVILVVVWTAFAAGPIQATAIAFVAGFCQDIYLPAELGLNALSKSVVGFAISVGRSRVMADTPQVQILTICAAVLVHDLIYYAGHGGVSASELPYYWLRYGLGRALYTGAVGAAIVYGLTVRRRLMSS